MLFLSEKLGVVVDGAEVDLGLVGDVVEVIEEPRHERSPTAWAGSRS